MRGSESLKAGWVLSEICLVCSDCLCKLSVEFMDVRNEFHARKTALKPGIGVSEFSFCSLANYPAIPAKRYQVMTVFWSVVQPVCMSKRYCHDHTLVILPLSLSIVRPMGQVSGHLGVSRLSRLLFCCRIRGQTSPGKALGGGKVHQAGCRPGLRLWYQYHLETMT